MIKSFKQECLMIMNSYFPILPIKYKCNFINTIFYKFLKYDAHFYMTKKEDDLNIKILQWLLENGLNVNTFCIDDFKYDLVDEGIILLVICCYLENCNTPSALVS